MSSGPFPGLIRFPSRTVQFVGWPGFVLLPAGQVFSIEKLDRLAPLRGLCSFKRWGLFAHPLPGLAVRTVHRSGEGFANQLALKNQIPERSIVLKALPGLYNLSQLKLEGSSVAMA